MFLHFMILNNLQVTQWCKQHGMIRTILVILSCGKRDGGRFVVARDKMELCIIIFDYARHEIGEYIQSCVEWGSAPTEYMAGQFN